jgi:hypothetical protein
VRSITFFLIAIALAIPFPARAGDEFKPAKQLISGYIDGDATLTEMSPPGGFITDKDELARLWKRWLLDEKAPAVDFGKYLVVVAVSKDGPIKSVTQRDEKKNGEMTIHITLDRKAKADGFHCMFAVFPRAGIKSIEGKEVKGK